MKTFLSLAVFSLLLPALVQAQAVRDTYAETRYLGASTFLSYIDEAGLTTLLKNPRENLTVFAPTQVAFTQLPADIRNRLESDDSFLQEVMRFHVVQGLQPIDTNNVVFDTLSGRSARVNVYTQPSLTTISGSPILLDHNEASNGEVNMVSRVMYPLPSGSVLDLVSGNNYDMLLLALSKAALTSMLNEADITFFAPSNSAFQKLPPGVFSDLLDDVPLLKRVLQTHTVRNVIYSAYVKAKGGASLVTFSGEQINITLTEDKTTLRIGSATVTSPDLNMNNGVVHVIDTVLLPSALSSASSELSFRVV